MEKTKEFLIDKLGTPKRLFILSLIMTLPFLFLVYMSFDDWGFIGRLDEVIGNEFIEARRPVLNTFFVLITRLGDVWFVTLFTAVIFIIAMIRKNYKIGIWYAVTVALGAGVLNQVVKLLFERPRPDEALHLVVQHGFSFPSGHAMGSVITYGALLFMIIRLYSTWKVPFISAIIIIPLILLIGFSRIYVGVHYFSDVIGGFSLGLATLSLSLGVYSLTLSKKEIKEDQQT